MFYGGAMPSIILAFLTLIFGLQACIPLPATANLPTPETSFLVQKGEHKYNVIPDPNLKVIRVYTALTETEPASELWLRIKKSDGVWDRIHITLNQTTPEQLVYSGIVPSRIQLNGAIQFDIDFMKNKRARK